MEFSLCTDSIYPEDGLKEKLERIKQAGFKLFFRQFSNNP
jgi:hypothetical protein